MKEQPAIISPEDQITPPLVHIYLQSRLLTIGGSWDWDLNSSAVFCSDVMAALSQPFEGTKSIIFPDDVEKVKQKVEEMRSEPVDFEFRIITSYGEVKLICGHDCYEVTNPEVILEDPGKYLLRKTEMEKNLEKSDAAYHQLKNIIELSERITETGWWYVNCSTNETYYSDNVFRIHGIPPQSLNPHPNTFNLFIHPDDVASYTDAFDKAFRNKISLHLGYRIIIGEEMVRYITLVTTWTHNQKGEEVLNGLIKDDSENALSLSRTEQAEHEVTFYRNILALTEDTGDTAYWYMNLLTRQIYFSDNYYRLHGLKPQSMPSRVSSFINFIHADDRERFMTALHKASHEHLVPELEYSIIRADKKVRRIQQSGQMLSYGSFEMIMVSTIRDVTKQAGLLQKLADLQQRADANDLMHLQSEQKTNTGSWILDQSSGHILWSDNLYELLGYKKTVKEFTEEQLYKAILPEDRKTFRDEMRFVMEGMGERSSKVRIQHTGEIHDIKCFFRMVTYKDRKYFVGTFQDITEIINTQKQLKGHLQLNQLFTENILDRVFMTDVQNNIILWNKRCEEFFNLKKEQVVGKNYFDVFPLHKNSKTITRFNNVLKGETIHEQNERSTNRKYYDLHMVPLREKGTSIIGILHIMHDVTREYQLKTSLNERLGFIEKLLEETVDRIIVVDKNYNYLYWNKKAEKHYHINKEYAIGKNVLEVFPAFLNDPLYLQFKKALAGETIHYASLSETDHQEKFSETYLIPLPGDRDEIIGILWIVHDLSKDAALKIAEEELQKIRHKK